MLSVPLISSDNSYCISLFWPYRKREHFGKSEIVSTFTELRETVFLWSKLHVLLNGERECKHLCDKTVNSDSIALSILLIRIRIGMG